MGASLVYLDKPNKDIDFDENENDYLHFAAGSMQGWRLNMVFFFPFPSPFPLPLSSFPYIYFFFPFLPLIILILGRFPHCRP
jgi:hypothetical protein